MTRLARALEAGQPTPAAELSPRTWAVLDGGLVETSALPNEVAPEGPRNERDSLRDVRLRLEVVLMFERLSGGVAWEQVETALLADALRRRARARRQYMTGRAVAPAVGRCRACGELGHNARGCPLEDAPALAVANQKAWDTLRMRQRHGFDEGTCGACGGQGHNARSCPTPNAAEVAAARRRARKTAWERARRAAARVAS